MTRDLLLPLPLVSPCGQHRAPTFALRPEASRSARSPLALTFSEESPPRLPRSSARKSQTHPATPPASPSAARGPPPAAAPPSTPRPPRPVPPAPLLPARPRHNDLPRSRAGRPPLARAL